MLFKADRMRPRAAEEDGSDQTVLVSGFTTIPSIQHKLVVDKETEEVFAHDPGAVLARSGRVHEPSPAHRVVLCRVRRVSVRPSKAHAAIDPHKSGSTVQICIVEVFAFETRLATIR